MANCAILGHVDDVCRHVVSKDEPFHGENIELGAFIRCVRMNYVIVL